MKNLYFRRRSLEKSPKGKFPLKKLPPVSRIPQSSHGTNQTSESINKFINTVNHEIEFFLQDANREISLISKRESANSTLSHLGDLLTNASPSPQFSEPENPFLYLTETVDFTSIKQKSPKKHERRQTIHTLFGPELKKNLTKKRDKAVEKITEDLEVPIERAEDLFEISSNKSELFSQYRSFRHKENNPDGDPNIFFISSIVGKTAPLPVLAHAVDRELILNRYRMNDDICSALKIALPEMTLINHLHLDSCGISDRGGAMILEGLQEQQILQSFFYTNNEIGALFSSNMKKFLQTCEVEELNLKGCKSSSPHLSQVISSFIHGKQLRKLNLSELGLNNFCMFKFSKIFKRCNFEHLDLSWNQISEEASMKFFKKLTRASKLQYLDYSWNNLASEKNKLAILLCKGITQMSNLLHLNISYTKLSDPDITHFFTPVAKSWTLLSLHLTGNPISAHTLKKFKEFIKASNEEFTTADKLNDPMIEISNARSISAPRSNRFSLFNSSGRSGHRDNRVNTCRSINDRDLFLYGDYPEVIISRVLGKTSMRIPEKWNFSKNCWICEKWNFCEIKVNISELNFVTSSSTMVKPVEQAKRLSFKGSHNYWNEIEMRGLGNEFIVNFLSPPGNQKFLFILDSTQVCVTENQPLDQWKGKLINTIQVHPRENEIQISYPIFRKQTTVLKVFIKEKSVFAPFREDTGEYLSKMFESDKKYYKFVRMFKNPDYISALHQRLLKDYKKIKEIYELLAAISNYPTIGWLDFSNFCLECGFVNNKSLTQADVDRIFIAVNYDELGLDENPSRELCRYEFYEILVRIAIHKYKSRGFEPVDALVKLLKKFVYPRGPTSKSDQFRKNFLYTYEVNEVLETNYSALLTVFNKYKDVGGRFMSLDTAKLLLRDSGVEITEKEVCKAYSFSKMSILDEMNSGGFFFKMQFVEMLEFVGRIASKTVTDSIGLHLKIELLLIKIFQVNGLQFNKPLY